MLAMPGAINEMDSSDEGAADLTILKPSFLKKRPWTNESIYRFEI